MYEEQIPRLALYRPKDSGLEIGDDAHHVTIELPNYDDPVRVGPVGDDYIDLGLLESLASQPHDRIDLINDDVDLEDRPAIRGAFQPELSEILENVEVSSDGGVDSEDESDASDDGDDIAVDVDPHNPDEIRRWLGSQFRDLYGRDEQFVDVENGEKAAYNHTTKSPDEISGNYGIYATADDPVIIVDIDDYDEANDAGLEAIRSLPATYTERTPHGGEHHVYVVDTGDDDDREVADVLKDLIGISNPVASWGEIRVASQYGVGAGSQLNGCEKDWHDCSEDGEGSYELVSVPESGVAEISVDELIDAMQDDPKTAKKFEEDDEEDGGDVPDDVEMPDVATFDDRLEYARVVDDNLDQHIKRVASGSVNDRSEAEAKLATMLGSWMLGDEKAVSRALDDIGAPKWSEREDDSYRSSVLEKVSEFPEYNASPDEVYSDIEALEVWRYHAENEDDYSEPVPHRALRWVAVKHVGMDPDELAYDDEKGYYRFPSRGLYTAAVNAVEQEYGVDPNRDVESGNGSEMQDRIKRIDSPLAEYVRTHFDLDEDEDVPDYPIIEIGSTDRELHAIPKTVDSAKLLVVNPDDEIEAAEVVEHRRGEEGNDLATGGKRSSRATTLVKEAGGLDHDLHHDAGTAALSELITEIEKRDDNDDMFRPPVVRDLIERSREIKAWNAEDPTAAEWEIVVDAPNGSAPFDRGTFTLSVPEINGDFSGFENQYTGYFHEKVDIEIGEWEVLTDVWMQQAEQMETKVDSQQRAALDQFRTMMETELDVFAATEKGVEEYQKKDYGGLYVEDWKDNGEDVVLVGGVMVQSWKTEHYDAKMDLQGALLKEDIMASSPTEKQMHRTRLGTVWPIKAEKLAELDVKNPDDTDDVEV